MTIQQQILSILDKLLSDPPLTDAQTDKILCIIEKMADFPLSRMTESVCVEEKGLATGYGVYLAHYGDDRIHCIKTIRNYTKLGLKEAKALSEQLPCVVLKNLSIETAQEIANEFRKGNDFNSSKIKPEACVVNVP